MHLKWFSPLSKISSPILYSLTFFGHCFVLGRTGYHARYFYCASVIGSRCPDDDRAGRPVWSGRAFCSTFSPAQIPAGFDMHQPNMHNIIQVWRCSLCESGELFVDILRLRVLRNLFQRVEYWKSSWLPVRTTQVCSFVEMWQKLLYCILMRLSHYVPGLLFWLWHPCTGQEQYK